MVVIIAIIITIAIITIIKLCESGVKKDRDVNILPSTSAGRGNTSTTEIWNES